MQLEGKTVVVTGGGSGIGRELVLQLLQKGARVAMLDVNEANMNETVQLSNAPEDRISVHNVDVSKQSEVEAFKDEVVKVHGQVDGVINNAGIIQPFVLLNELGYDQIQSILHINFYGTLYMVKAFLPMLLKRPEAHIANVSSMGGFIPFPGQTLYSASKAAVKTMTEGLYAELKDTRVGVTVVLPGAIDTHIMSNSGLQSREEEEKVKKNQSMKAMPADQAAAQIIRAIEKNRFRVLVGKDARMLDVLYRLHPRRAVDFIVKQMAGRL